jgi:hypothetical protein
MSRPYPLLTASSILESAEAARQRSHYNAAAALAALASLMLADAASREWIGDRAMTIAIDERELSRQELATLLDEVSTAALARAVELRTAAA